MSGHSKWAKLKHTKGASDAKKSKLFSRLANIITIATRTGGSGDPRLNFSLRDAVAKARAENLPQENVERAIKRGLGTDDGPTPEQVIFEAYGPGGAALLVSCITDNRNRILGEVKATLNAAGGRLGEIGSVMWMFRETGKITLPAGSLTTFPDFELKAIDAGAEDIESDESGVYLYAPKHTLEQIRSLCESSGLKSETGIDYRPTVPVRITDEEVKTSMETLLERLSELDDVEDVYTNADF